MSALFKRDSQRLQLAFRSAGDAAKAAIAAIAAADAHAGVGAPSSLTLGTEAIHAFWEVLSYPGVLEDDAAIEGAFLDALAHVSCALCVCCRGSRCMRCEYRF